MERAIENCETALDDDAESIITNERYDNITDVCDACVKKSPKAMTTTQKIDRIVTNRILGIPIFIVIMFLVYYISVSTVGTIVTDWANDGVFGDGWHLLGIGSSAYNDANDEYTAATGHLHNAKIIRPTCVAYGYTEYICETCGDRYVTDYVKPTGHNFTDEVIPAGKDTIGFTKHTCEVCGYHYLSDFVTVSYTHLTLPTN